MLFCPCSGSGMSLGRRALGYSALYKFELKVMVVVFAGDGRSRFERGKVSLFEVILIFAVQRLISLSEYHFSFSHVTKFIKFPTCLKRVEALKF